MNGWGFAAGSSGRRAFRMSPGWGPTITPAGATRRMASGYLYQYRAELPDEAESLELPRQRGVRILALTVAENPNDDLSASGVAYH